MDVLKLLLLWKYSPLGKQLSNMYLAITFVIIRKDLYRFILFVPVI